MKLRCKASSLTRCLIVSCKTFVTRTLLLSVEKQLSSAAIFNKFCQYYLCLLKKTSLTSVFPTLIYEKTFTSSPFEQICVFHGQLLKRSTLQSGFSTSVTAETSPQMASSLSTLTCKCPTARHSLTIFILTSIPSFPLHSTSSIVSFLLLLTSKSMISTAPFSIFFRGKNLSFTASTLLNQNLASIPITITFQLNIYAPSMLQDCLPANFI